jgi:predicted nucleotidyltransferase
VAKVLVSFPDEFLAEVDRIAGEEQRSRSELLREAARLYMERRSSRVRRRGAGRELSPADRRVARELARRLATFLPAFDLRVFGSRARGDPAPDSDLDIFIEVEEITPEMRRRISETAWQVGYELDRVIATVVATHAQVERGAMGASPLLANVEREGVRP